MTLNDLAVGQSAQITGLDADAGFGRRLLDLGFTVGERVACLFSAPSGEPRAYLCAARSSRCAGKMRRA